MYRLIILLASFANSLGNPAPDLPKHNIVGGKPASSIPYQISVEFNGRLVCGGSIISKRLVLTAGHCIDPDQTTNYWVRAGTNTREQDGQLVQIADYIIHPNYYALDYDIAVLLLDNSLQFSIKTNSIPMADVNDSLKPGTIATISGWGFDKENAMTGTQKLMVAKVPIVDKKTCETYIDYFTDRMICAGYMMGKIDACQEDSGGPLVANGKLFGVISSGNGCARPYNFGVYTSITALRLWIDETIQTLKSRN